jgi:hypothetical protein
MRLSVRSMFNSVAYQAPAAIPESTTLVAQTQPRGGA